MPVDPHAFCSEYRRRLSSFSEFAVAVAKLLVPSEFRLEWWFPSTLFSHKPPGAQHTLAGAPRWLFSPAACFFDPADLHKVERFQDKSRDRIRLVMKARVPALVSARRNGSSRVDKVYRRARTTTIATEDQALNALCDARLKERRHPLEKLLNQIG